MASPDACLGTHVQTHLTYLWFTPTTKILMENGCRFFQAPMIGGNGEWTVVEC